jgi:hypothetical protein
MGTGRAADRQRDERRRLFVENFNLNIFFTDNMNLAIMSNRWMKGAINAPDKKRPHPPHAANERDKAQRQAFKRHSKA